MRRQSSFSRSLARGRSRPRALAPRALAITLTAATALLATALAPGPARAQLQLAPQPPPEASWPRFACEQGECPAGVGALLTYRAGGEVGFCTATLIAPDRIVTAEHCVARVPARHAASMHFFLPDDRAVTVAWRAVLGVVHGEPRARGADHAILELGRPIDAPHPRLGRADPEPDGTLTVVRASAHSDRTVFVRREPCRVMPQALRADRMVPSQVVRIAGCTLLPGNSGAPMLDARGRVVAVVSTALEPGSVAVLLAPWLEGPAPFVGTVSSLACLPTALAPGAPPAWCASLTRTPDEGLLSAAEARDAAVDAQREALAERLIAWESAAAGADPIGWDLERRIRGIRTYALPVPGCVDVAALERTRALDHQRRFVLRMTVPYWEAVAFLGDDVRMVPRTQTIADVRMIVRGTLDETGDGARLRVRIRGTRVPHPRTEAHVPACREAE